MHSRILFGHKGRWDEIITLAGKYVEMGIIWTKVTQNQKYRQACFFSHMWNLDLVFINMNIYVDRVWIQSINRKGVNRKGERGFPGKPKRVIECMWEWKQKEVPMGWARGGKWFGRRVEKEININKV